MIDVDPGPATKWDEVLTLVRLYRAALDHLELRSVVRRPGELDDPKLRSDRWTILDADERVAAARDLFAGVREGDQTLPVL
jgi:hypothetical protein